MIEKSVVSQVVEYTFYSSIDEFSSYKDFLNDLRCFKEKDKVIIKVNSPGGRVDIGLVIIDAIKSCKAHVTCEVVHQACSMGALIALSGNELVMNRSTFLMFHDYSGFSFGKGNEQARHSAAMNKLWTERFSAICCPFLSKADAKLILSGQDVYIHDDDPTLKARIGRHFK